MLRIVLSIALFVIVGLGAQSSRGSVEGVVVDERTDAPISNVRVVLTLPTGHTFHTDSDSSGKFVVRDLSVGSYSIRFSKAGFYMSPNSSTTVALEVGDGRKILNLRLLPTASISGRVLDESGRPLSGATVVALKLGYRNGHTILLPPGSRNTWFAGDTATRAGVDGVTDETGEYRLFGLEQDMYYLGTWIDLERQPQGSLVRIQYYPGVTDAGQAAPIMVNAGNNFSGIDVRIRKQSLTTLKFVTNDPQCPGTTGGRPMFHVIRRSLNGVSITAAVVGLFGTALPHSKASHFRRTGDNRWESPEVYPGTYDIYYSPCHRNSGSPFWGHLNMYVADNTASGNPNDFDVLDIRSSVTIRGRVFWRSPGGIPPATIVSLIDLDNRSPFMLPHFGDPTNRLPPLTISTNGTFEVPNIPPGRYVMSLTPLPVDSYISTVTLNGMEVRDTGFELTGRAPSQFEVSIDSPGGVVEGEVRNLKKEAVSRALVVIFPRSNGRQNPNLYKIAKTDDDGAYQVRGIAPGEYGILAWTSVADGAYLNSDFLKRFESAAVSVRVDKGSASRANLVAIEQY